MLLLLAQTVLVEGVFRLLVRLHRDLSLTGGEADRSFAASNPARSCCSDEGCQCRHCKADSRRPRMSLDQRRDDSAAQDWVRLCFSRLTRDSTDLAMLPQSLATQGPLQSEERRPDRRKFLVLRRPTLPGLSVCSSLFLQALQNIGLMLSPPHAATMRRSVFPSSRQPYQTKSSRGAASICSRPSCRAEDYHKHKKARKA